MTEGRDSQRSKVYKAEYYLYKLYGAYRQSNDFSMEMTHTICQKILIENGLHMEVTIRKARNGAAAHRQDNSCTLRFCKGMFNMWVICHEVAHILMWRPKGGAHGPEYCRTYLRLVREYIGPHQAALLLESFKKHRVRLHD